MNFVSIYGTYLLCMKVSVKKLLFAAVAVISFSCISFAGLASQIDGIITQASQNKVRFGVHIVKADTDKTVYSHSAKEALVPASNMKIIVTAAAIKYLGPSFEYKTKVGLCGDTLAVIGSGDPLLGDKVTDAKNGRYDGWILKDISEKLKKVGITKIKDIIVDTSVFDDERVHPNWPKGQLNRWYACEVSGLNFNDNCIDVTVKIVKGRAIISIEPETSYVKLIDEITPVSKGRSGIGTFRGKGLNEIIVGGRCKKQEGPIAVAIQRPAGLLGYLLAEHLLRTGMDMEGKLFERPVGRQDNFKQIAEYSTPISDVLARSNKNSLQLAAEALLKTLSASSNAGQKGGSWAGGRKVIDEYLLGLGIERGEFYIDDGSGLSRENKLSANAITRVLSDVYNSENWTLYKDSLAVGGVDGTIGKYFKEAKYKGRVFGKTGYISGVKSFSGVCSTTAGDYIFSILTNKSNGQTRGAINDIAKAIIDSANK